MKVYDMIIRAVNYINFVDMLFTFESLVLILIAFITFRLGPSDEISIVFKLALMLTSAAIAMICISPPLTLFPIAFALANLLWIIRKGYCICANQLVHHKFNFGFVHIVAFTICFFSAIVSYSLPNIFILISVFVLIHKNEYVIAEQFEKSHWIVKICLLGLVPFSFAVQNDFVVALALGGIICVSLASISPTSFNKFFIFAWPSLLIALVLLAQFVLVYYVPAEVPNNSVPADLIEQLVSEGNYVEAVRAIRSQSSAQQFVIGYSPSRQTIRSVVNHVANIFVLVHSVIVMTVIAYKRTLRTF